MIDYFKLKRATHLSLKKFICFQTFVSHKNFKLFKIVFKQNKLYSNTTKKIICLIIIFINCALRIKVLKHLKQKNLSKNFKKKFKELNNTFVFVKVL